MKIQYWILLAIVFVAGMLFSQIISGVQLVSAENAFGGNEQLSPQDHVSEDQIFVYKDYIMLNVPGAQWSTFSNTNSMDPFLDTGANALQLVPKSPSDVAIGDIVSFSRKDKRTGDNETIIHRVVYEGTDEDGTYYITKGDNNKVADPGKIRFEQIERVLFAIIY